MESHQHYQSSNCLFFLHESRSFDIKNDVCSTQHVFCTYVRDQGFLLYKKKVQFYHTITSAKGGAREKSSPQYQRNTFPADISVSCGVMLFRHMYHFEVLFMFCSTVSLSKRNFSSQNFTSEVFSEAVTTALCAVSGAYPPNIFSVFSLPVPG